jgi:hypothetical protein
MKRLSVGIAALGVLCAVPVLAQPVVISDLNSTATIDPLAGMTDWTVDGGDQLFLQWFWFREGAVGPEATISSVGAPIVTPIAPNIVKMAYVGGGLGFEVTYILTGTTPGTGRSDIAESIRITNLTDDVRHMHFFQYTDFDLNGTPGGDTVTHSNDNTFDQVEAGAVASETIATPQPSRWEADFFPVTIAKLTDGDADDLANTFPLVGPGDVAFAWQWDFDLAPRQQYVISKDKFVAVPEPGTFAVLGLGLAGLLAARRRK